jgi:VanZ family protein
MWSNRREIKFWISAWLPVAFGIGIIVVESTKYLGADHTSGPLRWVFQSIFGAVTNARWEIIHHLIRKSGHFIGYGALGLTWLRAWRMTRPQLHFIAHAALALLGTGLVASWDEWHQSFLPNRGSSVSDVLLDCTGATVMLCLAYITERILRSKLSHRSS